MRRLGTRVLILLVFVCTWHSPTAAREWTGGAYESYEFLRRSLAKGKIPPGAEEALRAVLVDDADKQQLPYLIANTSPNELYAFLMRARASPDLLHGYLVTSLKREMVRADRFHDQRGRYYAWGAAYLLEAALTAFEATGEVRFLDPAAEAMLDMIEHRDHLYARVDSMRGRALKAWGNTDFAGEAYTSTVTQAGRIAAPMARFSWIVARQKQLQNRYGNVAAILLTAAAEAMREYDAEFRVYDDQGFYWRTIADRIEPLNHQTSAGEALLFLAAATRDPHWSRRAEQLATFARSALYKQSNRTIGWDYSPSPTSASWIEKQGSRDQSGSPEPVWKGQVTVRFMDYAERLGVVFTEGDLQAIAMAVRVNVLRDGVALGAYLSEQFVPLEEHREKYGGYSNIVPYTILARFDATLGRKIADLISSRPEIGGWLVHPKSATAYALRLDAGLEIP